MVPLKELTGLLEVRAVSVNMTSLCSKPKHKGLRGKDIISHFQCLNLNWPYLTDGTLGRSYCLETLYHLKYSSCASQTLESDHCKSILKFELSEFWNKLKSDFWPLCVNKRMPKIIERSLL